MGRRVRGAGHGARDVLWLACALCALVPAAARAQPWADVIEPGREAEVLGLLAPFRPGGAVEPGWRLGDVRIERSRVGFLLLLALVARQLRDAPRSAAPLLLAVIVVGALYRVWLAPETVLGAWPYSRTVPLVRRVWEGPGLATLSAWLDTPFAWFDFVTTLTLLFAAVTPLAVFAHVRALVGLRRIPCWSEPEPDARLAPACAAVLRAAPLEAVATTRFPTCAYDDNLAPAPDVRMIRLSLHRVRREGEVEVEVEAVEPEAQAPARPRPR